MKEKDNNEVEVLTHNTLEPKHVNIEANVDANANAYDSDVDSDSDDDFSDDDNDSDGLVTVQGVAKTLTKTN